MSAEQKSLELIRREMMRLQHDHICRLTTAFNQSVAEFSPMRRPTLGLALKSFSRQASADLVAYAALVRQQVVLLTNRLLLPLSEDMCVKVLAIAGEAFDADIYIQQFNGLQGAFVRKGAHCGIKVSDWGGRPDIEQALLQVGTINAIRRALAALADELAVIKIQSSNEAAALKRDRETMVNNTVNVTGDNARFYQNSVDNSTSVIVNNPSISQYIEDIKDALTQAALSATERQAAMELVDEIVLNLRDGSNKKSVLRTLLSALPNVANVATIAASLASLIGLM